MLRLADVHLVVSALLVCAGETPATTDGERSGPAAPGPGSYVLSVADGALMRLGVPGSVAVLSPDGSLAAVATPEGAEAGVRVVALASGAVSVPLASEVGHVGTPVWPPDGRLLAFRFERNGRPDRTACALPGWPPAWIGATSSWRWRTAPESTPSSPARGVSTSATGPAMTGF